MKKKILVTSSTFPRWHNDSVSPFIFELCRKLVQYDLEIIVLAPFAKHSKRFEIVDGVRVHRFRYLPNMFEDLAYDGGILAKLRKNKLNYLKIPFFLIGQIIAIRNIVRAEKIETIHAHWVIPQGLVAVLYKKIFNKRIRILCTAHGSDLLDLKNRFSIWQKKFVLKNIDMLTVVSKHLGDVAKQLYGKTMTKVLPMGIDFRQFVPHHTSSMIREKFDARRHLLLFAGRLTKEKGIRLLMDIMPDILLRFPETKLLIAGKGDLEHEIRDFISNRELENNVFLLGFVEHAVLADYLTAADILVGPSLHEGLGLIFIEALACGCAVIASDLPSMADIIIDRETGLKVTPNDPKSLSEKITELLSDHGLMEHIKQRARALTLQRYDLDKVAENYSALLRP